MTIVEYYDRVKWVIVVFYGLWKQGYSGPVKFEFYKGNISKNFKREVIETAPGE